MSEAGAVATRPNVAAESITAGIGGVAGGVFAAAFVVGVTELIKSVLAVVVRQDRWVLVVVPLVGVALAVAILHLVAHGEAVQRLHDEPVASTKGGRRITAWLRFPSDVIRADLTADVVRSAGTEERFPWRLAPIRAAAIIATVGLGAPMGTESPAAHLGVAAGTALGRIGQRWSRYLRAAAVGGGTAGVAALMGLPVVGVVFMLELGRRNAAPVSVPRLIAAAAGALVGWAVNAWLGLNLIRLVVPTIAPRDLAQALGTAAFVGALSGVLCSITGSLIYRTRTWRIDAVGRLVGGAVVLAGCALAIGAIATPVAAVGPGATAVAWAELSDPSWWRLLLVATLRAVATTAAVAAGGCGGLFVPFLSIGDLCGRAMAPVLGASGQLTAAAGAAGGIAGGYRLPLTAVALVLTVGGPAGARATCVATVVCAALAGVAAAYVLDHLLGH